MRRYRGFHQGLRKRQSQLAEAFAVSRVGVDLAGIAMIESGEIAALIARASAVHLLRERFELHGVRAIGERIILLLVEKFLVLRVDHARRFLRAEHRIGVDLHALPGRWVSHIVGVPPLHFKIDQARAGAPCHGDAVA